MYQTHLVMALFSFQQTMLIIAQMCADHVSTKYNNAIVVFDGYEKEPSTKDQTDRRRSKDIVETKVIFTKETPFRSNKDLFLRNSENK